MCLLPPTTQTQRIFPLACYFHSMSLASYDSAPSLPPVSLFNPLRGHRCMCMSRVGRSPDMRLTHTRVMSTVTVAAARDLAAEGGGGQGRHRRRLQQQQHQQQQKPVRLAYQIRQGPAAARPSGHAFSHSYITFLDLLLCTFYEKIGAQCSY